MKKVNGFTLIELLVVVLIIGILAAVALPQYQKAVNKSRTVEVLINIKALLDAQKRYILETGSYAQTFGELDISISGTPNAADTVVNAPGYIYDLSNGGINPDQIFAAGTKNSIMIWAQVSSAKLFCRALLSNSQDVSICKSLGGTTDSAKNLAFPSYYYQQLN
jgi:prepilin-type N-terminal cleavage/methylation domain-containing protein